VAQSFRHGGRKLGDQFLHGVAFVAETLAPEIAAEPQRVTRPVRHFVREGC
jgi:hypothetical protein